MQLDSSAPRSYRFGWLQASRNGQDVVVFSFALGRRDADIDATLERLLQLPAELGGAGKRRTALIMDEFQEIVDVDSNLPPLLRSVFQQQPEVAHIYLGSKRHVMEQIFSDVNEPFWRSAKPIELGMIEALAAVLRSEHAHFTLLWEGASSVQRLVLQALAQEPGRPFTGDYRARHNLPASTNVQKALRALERRE